MKSWNGYSDALVAPRRAPAGTRFLTAAFAALVIIAGLDTIFPKFKYHFIPELSTQPPLGAGHTQKPFQWPQITPQKHLEFHKCFDGFECAKLSLPLDYFNGAYPDHTVSVAIAKLPAKVPINDPRYGGPILLNPGGPGGPGALFALTIANSLQTIVDADIISNSSLGTNARFFDIIGFDPRGVGETEPAATCMSDPASAWSWALRETEEGVLGSSDAALGRLWSMTHAFGSSCKQAMDAEDGPDIKQYMTTAFVARDMLEIIEKHAKYVARQAVQLMKDNRSGCSNAHLTKYTRGETKLQYWGFSYGTHLGSTFASMFPDRIGRVVLDGVVNAYDYNHALGNGSLIDNEKTMESFYSFCLQSRSGPKDCPLGANATTTAEIKDRAQKIVFTYSDLKTIIFTSIYEPELSFPFLGNLLPQIEAGSGDIIDSFTKHWRGSHTLSCGINGSVTTPMSNIGVPTYAILCTDGIDQQNVSIDEFVEYWNLLRSMSSAAGDIWATLMLKCSAWKIRASHKFEGEFGAHTSNPILFISNTADPVTPLRSGRLMQSKFLNSVLLVNDQAGHCSFSAVNLCALERIKTYFQTGLLPAPNTLCVPPYSPFSLNSTDPKSPFYDPSLEVGIRMAMEGEITFQQKKLHMATKHLQRVMAEHHVFGFRGLFGGKATKVQKMAAARYLG